MDKAIEPDHTNMPGIFIRILLAWLVLLALAILNGGFRQGALAPRLDDRAAHILSTLLLSGIIFAATWFSLPWIRPASARDAWLIGSIWFLLTIAFEFLAGHYLFGSSWKKLLADYNLAQGRIWILVLLSTLLSPILVYGLRYR